MTYDTRLTPGLYKTLRKSFLFTTDNMNTPVDVPRGSILFVLEVLPEFQYPKDRALYGDWVTYKVLFEERVLHAGYGDKAIFEIYERIYPK